MQKLIHALFFLLLASAVSAQAQRVAIVNDGGEMMLTVEGQPFMINGMNWDYFPIGTNFNYSLWKQSDDVIRAALDEEMGLLKNMGVNAVRMYTGVPAKWITYIYDKHGIYTMLNHARLRQPSGKEDPAPGNAGDGPGVQGHQGATTLSAR